MLKMELEYNQPILFVRLKGNLDRKNSYKINNYLNPILRKHNIKYLVYNWCDLKSIDNAGVDAILNSKFYIKCNKGKMRVCSDNVMLEALAKHLKIPRIKKENEAFKLMEMI